MFGGRQCWTLYYSTRFGLGRHDDSIRTRRFPLDPRLLGRASTTSINATFFLLFHMASGRKQADARYDYCPCTPCRTHDPPFVQQRRTIHRHRQREEMNMRDKALVTARSGKTSLRRALKKPDDPGIPNAVKSFRVGRTGYVIAGEASTGLGKLFPLPLPQNLSTFAQKANLPHLNSTYA